MHLLCVSPPEEVGIQCGMIVPSARIVQVRGPSEAQNSNSFIGALYPEPGLTALTEVTMCGTLPNGVTRSTFLSTPLLVHLVATQGNVSLLQVYATREAYMS